MTTPDPQHQPSGAFSFDLNERFQHLNKPPIVEAILQVNARATSAWEEGDVIQRLKAALPDYPQAETLQAGSFVLNLQPRDSPRLQVAQEDMGWQGAQFRAAGPDRIARFTRDHFLFSRLRPYTDWTEFSAEATRLFKLHQEVSGISEMAQVRLRFINTLEVPDKEIDFARYFRGLGALPIQLPVATFLHQETLAVPEHSLAVNLTRTIQPSGDRWALIADIDVFTTEARPVSRLEKTMSEMRWLKNKVFFGALSEAALEMCR